MGIGTSMGGHCQSRTHPQRQDAASPPIPMTTADPSGAKAGAPQFRTRDAVVALSCVAIGLGFGAWVWLRLGSEPAQQYLAGYLIELSLSVDNVLVFALVFDQFDLDPRRQRRLLFWGVVGAVILRSAFILAGIGAISRFAWIIPAFGAVILATGIRLATKKGGRTALDPSGRAFRFVTRHAPASLAALIVLETADLIFALDSLPAVLAVTHSALIAIASNLFAILGLRSLFFVVSRAMRAFRFLNAGLAAILSFVGVKMIAEPWYPIPTSASLAVIAAILAISIGASVAARPRPGH
jgi:tellurite resistance protein TerC